jgi:hypothetical protein
VFRTIEVADFGGEPFFGAARRGDQLISTVRVSSRHPSTRLTQSTTRNEMPIFLEASLNVNRKSTHSQAPGFRSPRFSLNSRRRLKVRQGATHGIGRHMRKSRITFASSRQRTHSVSPQSRNPLRFNHNINRAVIPRASVRPRSRQSLHPSWLPKYPDEVFLDRCRELVFKLRHGLQFILSGVIHRVIGIPMITGAGSGGCRGGSCGTGGGLRSGVSSGSSCRRIRWRGRC